MKLLRNIKGYFVDGLGFSGTQANATRINEDDVPCIQKCAARMGHGETSVEDAPNRSFAVTYIRKGDVKDGQLDKQAPNTALGQLDPSRRRFATFEEARVHGSRFHVRRHNRGDAPGSAGHVGFFITETNDPVNAKVNPETGLTNPL